LSEPRGADQAAEGGSAVVEFVLVSALAVILAMSLAQLGLFLWERNALLGSLSEGARVAATEGRSVADGQRVAAELLSRSAGGRVADAVLIDGTETAGMVVLRAEGTLPVVRSRGSGSPCSHDGANARRGDAVTDSAGPAPHNGTTAALWVVRAPPEQAGRGAGVGCGSSRGGVP
jgi:hypothetical protein